MAKPHYLAHTAFLGLFRHLGFPKDVTFKTFPNLLKARSESSALERGEQRYFCLRFCSISALNIWWRRLFKRILQCDLLRFSKAIVSNLFLIVESINVEGTYFALNMAAMAAATLGGGAAENRKCTGVFH